MSFLRGCLAVVRRRDARLVLSADIVSKSGDWLFYVAMSVLLFHADGTAALGVFNATRIALPIMIGPVAGRWGTPFRPRAVMVSADVFRAAALGAAAAGVLVGMPTLWLLAPTVLCGIATSLHAPAERRFQRDLVGQEDRAALNAVIGTSGTLVIVVAPAIGGVLSAWIGASWLLALDSGSYLVSAMLISRAGNRRPTSAVTAPEARSTKELEAKKPGALRSGLAAITADRKVLSCVLSQAASCTAAGASLVFLIPIAHRLAGGDTTVGVLTAGIGVGSVIGCPIGGPSAKKERVAAAGGCVVVMGLLLGLFGIPAGYAVALLLAVLLGVVANVGEPIIWTLYGNRVPDQRSGPFYGLVESVIGTSLALGGTAAGLLAAAFGVVLAAWLIGGLVTLIATSSLLVAVRLAGVSAAPDSLAST